MTALSQLFHDEHSASSPAAIEQAIELHLVQRHELASWIAFEQSRAGQDHPEWVAKTFLRILQECEQSGAVPEDLLMHAFEFCNEWFSTDPTEQACALIELAKLAPENQAVFDQCTVTLTHAQRWEALLAIHDRRVEVAPVQERRGILEQAAQIAQDFEQDAARALSYYAAILELEPENERIFSIFVRLVTREKAWSLYAETLAKRAPHLSAQEAQAALLDRAQLLIEQLGDYPNALGQYAAVLEQDPNCEAALDAITRVSQDTGLELESQCLALGHLFNFYQAKASTEQSLEIISTHIEKLHPSRDATLEYTRISLLKTLGKEQERCTYGADFFLRYHYDERAVQTTRELMNEAAQPFSKALLSSFEKYSGNIDFAVANSLLASSKELVSDEQNSELVAPCLARIFSDVSVETQARQQASQLFQELNHEDRYLHENADSLEQQVELATQEATRVALLIRLADRLADDEESGTATFGAWQRVMELRPAHVQAQDKIEAELYSREDWESLAEHLEHGISHCAEKDRELQLQLKLVHLDLDQRGLCDQGIARMQAMLQRFPDAEQVAQLYHQTLLANDRYQEFVDWLKPRSFARRDVPAMVECGEVYLRELSNKEECAQCVLEALGVRPDLSSARSLGLELLASNPDFDKAPLANAVWRSYSTVDIAPEQLDDFETIASAYPDKEIQAKTWLQAEARFGEGASQSLARLRCLCNALAREPRETQLPAAFLRLIQDDPTHAPAAFEAISTTLADQGLSLSPDCAAGLYDLAAALGQQAHEESVAASSIVKAKLQAWRIEPTPARHLRALHGAIDACDWDAVVELTVQKTDLSAAFEPGDLWSKVCQETHPAPESIPLDLVQNFADYFAQDPDRFDRSRIEWTWQLSKLLAHHQDFLNARDLALPLAYQEDIPMDPSRLRTLYAWLRMEPPREKEALDLADNLADQLNLSVEERRAHAALDRKLRAPGSLGLQLAAWESCERTLLAERIHEDVPAPVLAALHETLGAYIAIALDQSSYEAAVQLAHRALSLRLPYEEYERVFAKCWSALDYPEQASARLANSPKAVDILSLLALDRQRLLEYGCGYQSPQCLWRGEMLVELLGAHQRYFEQMEVLAERLERAEAQGPPNTPQQLMQLRLAISATLRDLSRDDGQLNYLLSNLDVIAAHPESLGQAAALLHERGDHERLAKLWSDQASALVEHHDGDRKLANVRAAELWCKAAQCYETQLESPQRAVQALEEARKLVSKADILDKLVKFYLSDECLDRSRAAAHLHRRLDLSCKEERLPLSYRLAQLYLDINQARQSQSVIDEVFEEAASVIEFRRLYLQAVDSLKQPSEMLAARVRLTHYFSETELDHATETATRLLSQLDAHEIDIRELLPLLEQSAPHKPGDLALQKHYVTALSATGRRDDATTHLATLIATHGRRRSAQRAALHAMLGDQYALSKQLREAALQFEQAALMDSAQARRWIDVAKLYESLEDIASAERALRTLMVHAQKRDSSDVRTPNPAWVMLQMYLLNRNNGNTDVAERHWESCRDRCASDIQAAREVLCELSKSDDLHERYLELAGRLLQEDLSNDFKAEVLAQRAEHLEQSEDSDGAFGMVLDALAHDPAPASYSATALRLADTKERVQKLDELLDGIIGRDEQQGQSSPVERSQKVMAYCAKARLCAKDPERHADINGYLEKAQALEIRPIEYLRTRHDVAYQIGDMELLRSSLESMHQQNVLAEPSLGDSWLARAEQYSATSTPNFRLALRAVDEALSSGVSRRRALDVLLAFPRFENLQARNAVLDTMQGIAQELCDEQAVLKVLEERLQTELIDALQLQQLYHLATQNERHKLALTALEQTLARFDETKDPNQLWAVWAFIDHCLEADTCSPQDQARIWGWLHHCGQASDESTIRDRVSRVIERAWFPEEASVCIRTLETLVESNATYAPYRNALWELYACRNDIGALVKITQRNLALLEDSQERAQMRLRFVEATRDNDDASKQRIEMLRSTIAEDPGHTKALDLLIAHYRQSGELDQLQALLKDQLEGAREREDALAQAQLGLSLAKLSYDQDPIKAIIHCRELFEQSEEPQVEISEVCVQWLTQDSGREHFARAFGYQELGTPDAWGHYQAFLLERYEEIIAHGELEQRKSATLQAAAMLADAARVNDAIALLVAYREQHSICPDIEAALYDAYAKNERHDELVELLLTQAKHSEDTARAYQLTQQAAQITKEQLDAPQRALKMLEALEMPFGSPEHYQLLHEKIAYIGEDDPNALLQLIGAGLPQLEALEAYAPEEPDAQELTATLGHVELQAKKAELLVRLGRHKDAQTIYALLAQLDAERYRSDWVRCQSAHLDALIACNDTAAAQQAWSASVQDYLEGAQEQEDEEDNGERLCSLGRRLADQGLRDAGFLRDLAKLATNQGDDQLEALCQEWTIACDDPETAMAALGRIIERCIEKEDYDKARDYLDQCAEALTEQPEYIVQLKKVYELQENYQELAKLEFESASKQEEESSACAAYKQAALWFEKAEDFEGVRASLEQAAAKSPQDHDLLVRLVDLDLQREDTQAASERLDQALAAVPKDKENAGLIAQLSYKKSQLMGACGETDAQLEWLQKAHNMNRTDVEIASALADLAESQESWDLASRVLRQLSSIGEEGGAPPTEELCIRQARLWQSAKDLRKASFWAHKARHAAPNSDEIRELLEELAAQQREQS